jgi:hypothetical protein
MLDCVDLGLVDEDFVREFWPKWHEALINRAKSFPRGIPRTKFQEQLMFALDDVLLASSDSRTERCPGENDLRLRRRVRAGRMPASGFVHITRVDLFVKHAIARDDLRRLAGTAILRFAPGSGTSGITWRGRAPSKVSLRDGATLGRPNGVLWLTLVDAVEADMDFAGAADRVRDRLGLVHYAAGVPLLAVQLEPRVIAGKETARPTFADAGSHRRFKVMADKAVNRRRVSWGFSADLSLLALERKWIDGAPERVACPLRSHDVGSLSVRFLGETSADVGRDPEDDVTFAKRLSIRHKECAGVRRRIEKLLA